MKRIRKKLTLLLVAAVCAVSVLPAYASSQPAESSGEITGTEEIEKEKNVSENSEGEKASVETDSSEETSGKDGEKEQDPSAEAKEEQTLKGISLPEKKSEVPAPIASAGAVFKEEVKAAHSQEWGTSTPAVPGEAYSYRISLTAGAKEMSDIIIYDVLRDGEIGKGSTWYGELKSCAAEADGADVQIYYSTKVMQKDLGASPASADLSNSEYWSKNMPSGIRDITAVAFDLRKAAGGGAFKLQPGKTLRMTINMTTDGDSVIEKANDKTSADNYAWYTSGEAVPTGSSLVKSGTATVTLHNPDVKVSISSDPAYGNQEEPAKVKDNSTVIYDICITNNEDFQLMDIDVEDLVGGDLTPNADGIRYYKGSDSSQEKSIEEDSTVTYKGTGPLYEGRVLCIKCGKDLTDMTDAQMSAHLWDCNSGYTVKDVYMGESISLLVESLGANETLHLLVPLEVKSLSKKVVFSNQAKILSISSYKGYHSGSAVCWHTSEPEYAPGPLQAELEFRGKLNLSGRAYTSGDSFTVLMESEEEGTPMPADTSVQLKPESGNTVEFTLGGKGNTITYTKPGTYHYTFRLDSSVDSGLVSGITYDGTVYRVTIEVVDNKDGTMTAKQTGLEKKGSSSSVWETASSMEFTLQYIAVSCEHTWDTGRVIREATCTATGVKRYTCTKCGATRDETIEKKPHTEVKDVRVEPTCTVPGKTEGKHCSVCGEVLVAQQTIDALGHNWDNGSITKSATCSEAGIKTFKCSRCSETKTEEIPKLPHTKVADERVEPTCTEPGKTEGSHCSVCGEVIDEQKVIPALGHAWDEGEITKEATYQEAGTIIYTCTRCGIKEEKTIPKLEYHIISGARSTWTKGSGQTVTIISDGDFNKFVSVEVDGTIVDDKNYEAKAGSTIITFKTDYLETLEIGTHTYRVNYTDGYADTIFTVKAKAAGTLNPKNTTRNDSGNGGVETADNSMLGLWTTLLVISFGTMIASLRIRRKI